MDEEAAARRDKGAIAFAERLITLIDQSATTATYKYALLLALLDVCREHTAVDGSAPTTVSTRDLARRVVELYWPQSAPFVSTHGRLVLRQNSGGQAQILRAICDFRERHMPDPSAPLSRAQAAGPRAFDRLLERVEWKLIEMPIPRLQVAGGKHEPFVYRISWDTTVRRADVARPDFDRRLHLVGMAGEYLVQLAGLLRPLVEAKWLALVRRFNAAAINDPGLETFLFGASRVSTGRLRSDLRELQDGRCFYCDAAVRSAGEVDHFLPWVRWPDNGIENLVFAHATCNHEKRDFLAAAAHLRRWSRRFVPTDSLSAQLADIADRARWDRHPDRTLGVARALYLHLPDEAELWLRGGEFVHPDWREIRSSLGAGPARSSVPSGR